MKFFNKIAVSILLLCQIACSKTYQSVPGGIMLDVDSHQVVMTTVDDHSFRLAIRTQGKAETAIASIFLDTMSKEQPKYKVLAEGHLYGIETNYGRLMMDMDSLKWTLWGKNKDLLISKGVVVFSDSLQQIGFADNGRCYGAGNYSTKNLIKESSSSKMSNGTTDVPYLWNSKGYALFGVSENDDQPASWKSNEKGDLLWSFKGKSADLYLWPARNIYEGTQKLMNLTGRAKLPPKWAFGIFAKPMGLAGSELH